MSSCYLVIVALTALLKSINAQELWCYACTSAQSGCGPPIDVRLMHWKLCKGVPLVEDMCVKVIEKIDDQVIITRDCLSHILLNSGIRLDTPKIRRHGYCLYSAANQRYLQQHLKGTELALWSMGALRPETENFKLFCFCNDWPGCNSQITVTAQISLPLLCLAFTLTFSA